jgi:3-hydroxyacyl-[acyl-carrier protein] dehydratase/trans-2-decenoyl-[acyl-carrier protein] isomerase
VDAVWQLLGFFCVWRGALGSGRALGCGEVVFGGQVRPYNRLVRYEIEVRRFTQLRDSGAAIVIGEGRVLVDGEEIAEIHGARSGVFRGIAYPDYPRRSTNSIGGRMRGGL